MPTAPIQRPNRVLARRRAPSVAMSDSWTPAQSRTVGDCGAEATARAIAESSNGSGHTGEGNSTAPNFEISLEISPEVRLEIHGAKALAVSMPSTIRSWIASIAVAADNAAGGAGRRRSSFHEQHG